MVVKSCYVQLTPSLSMKVLILVLGLMCTATSGLADVSLRQFHRLYQPQLSSVGKLEVTGKWHEIPSAQIAHPRTWVAPFLQSGSELVPKCSLTTSAGIEVTSVMGIVNPLITIHIADKHSLDSSLPRVAILESLIECIQMNMKDGAFINVKVSVADGVPAEEYALFEGSYTTLKTKGRDLSAS